MDYKLRKICENDLEMIMNWRMQPDITRYMNTDPKLTLDMQKKWFASLQNNDQVKYWMIMTDNTPIGIINLAKIDWEKKNTSWAYYIGEKKGRSMELAIALEMSLYDHVFDVLELDEIYSDVFSLNKGVIKLHELCGCKKIKEIKDKVEKNGIKYDVTYLSISRQEWFKYRIGKKYIKIDFNV